MNLLSTGINYKREAEDMSSSGGQATGLRLNSGFSLTVWPMGLHVTSMSKSPPHKAEAEDPYPSGPVGRINITAWVTTALPRDTAEVLLCI